MYDVELIAGDLWRSQWICQSTAGLQRYSVPVDLGPVENVATNPWSFSLCGSDLPFPGHKKAVGLGTYRCLFCIWLKDLMKMHTAKLTLDLE